MTVQYYTTFCFWWELLFPKVIICNNATACQDLSEKHESIQEIHVYECHYYTGTVSHDTYWSAFIN